MEFKSDQFTLTMINEPTYTVGSADNTHKYEKEYLFAKEYRPSSFHGLQCSGSDKKNYSCLLAGQGGTTGVHKRSAVIVDNNCYVAIGDSLCSLSVPQLTLNWNLKVDDATCFGVYYSAVHRCLFSHGELEIARLTLDGKILWSASGKDIFTEGFEILENEIEVIDFNKEVYRIEIQSGRSRITG